MYQFLLSLLTLALTLSFGGQPTIKPFEIVAKIQERLSTHEEPQGTENPPGLVDQAQNSSQSSPATNNENPDTTKVPTYNTKSGKYIGEVAAVAVDKAEPLVNCSEVPGQCDGEANVIPPTPTPTPTEPPGPVPCIPPPPCIYEKPACLPVVPEDGWCPTEPIPVPTIIPIKPLCGCPPSPYPPYVMGNIKCLQGPVVCLE